MSEEKRKRKEDRKALLKLLLTRAKNSILFPKLFRPTVRKNCSSDQEKFSLEFAKFLRSQEQFIQTVKGQNNFW